MKVTDPFFQVERVPAFIELKGERVDLGRQALVNQDIMRPVGVVSPDYELIHNSQVADIFSDALTDTQVASWSDHLDTNGRRWRRRVILNKDEFNFDVDGHGDFVGVMIEIFNDYTGRMGYGYSIMGFRWACKNGMIVGKRTLFSESFTHLTDALERIRLGFELRFAKFRLNTEIWKTWTQTSFTESEMRAFLESRPYLSEKGAGKVLGAWVDTKTRENLDNSKWSAFNAITWLGTHALKTRKEADPLFSNSAAKYALMAEDFYSKDEVLQLAA